VERPTSRRLTGTPAPRADARPPPRGEDPSRCARGRTLSTRALWAQGTVPEPLDGGALATASTHAGEGARGGAISSGRRSVCSGRKKGIVDLGPCAPAKGGRAGGGGATSSGRHRQPPLQEPSLAGGEKKGPARGRAAAAPPQRWPVAIAAAAVRLREREERRAS